MLQALFTFGGRWIELPCHVFEPYNSFWRVDLFAIRTGDAG